MPPIDAVSGQETGNAGDDDAFSKAFDAAVESSKVEDDVYAPDAKIGKGDDKRVVSDSTEDAAGTKAGKEKAPKVEASQEPAAEVAAPAHWDAQKREAFGALPPEAKKIVNDLAKGFEVEFTRKTTELAEDRKFAQGVRSLITDNHRAQLRSAGMDEVAGLQHLIRLNDFATRDAPGYVRWVIEQTGLKPTDVFPALAGQGGQQAPQPASQSSPSDETLRMLRSLASDVEGIKRSSEQQTYRQADRAIQRFRSETDEGGQPKYPHFAKVESAMTELLQTPKYMAIEDFGERLMKAYDVAVLMDPDIRTQIVDSDVQRRLKDQQAQADLAKAKRAQAPVKSAPTGAPKAKPTSIDEALSSAMSMTGVS